MIPILFKENETNFNSNGIGFLNETINYEVTEERNGAFELELEYPVSGKWFKELKDFRLILAKPNDTDEDHLFRIYEIVKDLASQTVNIYATTRSNDLGGNLVQGVTVNNETPQLAMNKMKANLIQPTDYKFVSDIQTKSSTEWIRRNPLNCIAGEEGSLVNYWGGEIKRTNDTIYLYSRRGRDKVTLIRQGKNLEGFELTSSTKGMITRILPFFTYTPEGKDDEVTITGSIVDSPLVNNYPVKYITPVDYSFDDTIDSLAKLNAAAKSYFAYQNPDCDKPSVNMQIDLLQLSDSSEYAKFKDLEHIGLTDTVEVWVEKFDVDVEVKINELTYNGSLGQVTNIVAGSQPHTLYDDVKKDYKDDFSYLEKYINSMENGIRNTIQVASDGKSTIFRGYTEPPIDISKLNDLWFKELGSGEVEAYIFDGAYWQPYITAGLNEAVKAEVRAILAQAEADRIKVEADIGQAVIDAEEYTEQKAKEFDAKLVIVNQEITSVKNSADQSGIKADQAIKDAGFAQVDASAAKVSATNALSAANAAKTDASSALTKANAAVTDASKALTNANSALTRVGAVEVTTGSLTTSYDALTKTVALKADQTTVDGINGKVTTQGLAITANATAVGLKADKTLVDTINSTVSKHTTDIKATADGLLLKADSSVVSTLSGTVTTHTTQIKAASDGLALKADSSLVNTIKGTVDTHTTQIKATSDGLALKADSTLVNTIKGTVDTHSTKISANSTAISARLTSAQVETILTGKKYVNETTLSATSAGLTAQITQVSNDLSNLEIGGRNHFVLSEAKINTAMQWSNGAYFNEIGSVSSGFIPTKANEAWITSIENASQVLYFGSDKQITSWYTPMTTGTRKFITPNKSDIAYMKISFRNNFLSRYSLNEIKIEKGTVATDWSPAPEDMATVERVVTIEANINGIQTTVAAKADKTQITQLSNQISTKVESSTYNSKMTQLDQAINLRVVAKDVTDAILADKTVKDTRANNELPAYYYTNYPRQTVEEFKLGVVMGATGSGYGILTTKVPWGDSSGGAIIQTFSAAAGVYQRQGSSGWGAWEKVADANRLITQINLSAETSTILIQGRRIMLDGNVTMDQAFITRLDTQTLSAVTANIATIRTKMLTTDVVLSTMIKSDTALITKLFATDANVSILTAKTAFINSVKAIDISADRVTAGTLNAAKVSIINLDASRITTGVLNGIKITSSFNYSYDGAIMNSGVTTIANGEITMNGNFTHAYGGTFLKINPDTIYAENMQANGSVRSMFKLSGQGLEVNKLGKTANYTQDGIYFEKGGSASIVYSSGNARIAVGSYNGVDLGTMVSGYYHSRFAVGGGSDGIESFVNAYVPFTAREGIDVFGKTIKNAYTVTDLKTMLFAGSSNRIVQGSDGFLNILSPMQLSLGWTDGSSSFTTMIITRNQIVAKKNFNMDGNQMIGVSDARLKTAINTTTIDSLSAISRWKFVDFNWRYDDKPKGRQFGLIAQDTPELALYDAMADEYTISASKQIMMTSHGLSQLNDKVLNLTALTDASNATANQALSEVQMLRQEVQQSKQEIDKLKQKIEQMESAA